MFKSILVANRGEIAVRIMKTARRMGLRTIAVYSDADRGAMHVAAADDAVWIGPSPATESYLRIEAILDAARRTGAEAVHPGYGFLSENADFADACAAAGLVFVGPPATAIRAMGLKDAAKRAMEAAGVPVVPGYHGEDQSPGLLEAEARRIGFPVLVKARAGGGGRGMRRVDRADDFHEALGAARREALASFGDGAVIVETWVPRPRHIEVQVFADAHGNGVHLFERDCSLQRRHQKVIEEAPAPGMTAQMREAMGAAAVKAALAVGYRGAGTVEFIADASDGLRPDRFFFMEMNTRLQVEHPVTEAITGFDLVAWQLRVARGERFTRSQADIAVRGHAIEARIYAEDPSRGFAAATGRITHLELPHRIARVDAGVRSGDAITPFYDPMIAKVIVCGRTRAAALEKMRKALDATVIAGCVTNVGFLANLIQQPDFVAGDVDTGLIERDLERLVVLPDPDPVAAGLAALAVCGFAGTAQDAHTDAWSRLKGWRQWGAARSVAHLTHHGTLLDVSVTSEAGHLHAVASSAGSAAVDIEHWDGEHVRFAVGGRSRRARVTSFSGGVAVHLDGIAHVFGLAIRDGEMEDERGGENEVRSSTPGLVKSVTAAAGDKVARGDPLVIVEAMKMEHTLAAPRDGVVAEITVSAGDLVQEGVVLVRLEA